MTTYVYRCKKCKVDWEKQFPMSEKPDSIQCPDCGVWARSIITSAPVIFRTSGFPSNDSKGLHDGKSSHTRGRKPTHQELDFVEKHYPDSNEPTKTKVEELIDKAKSGSKKDALYSATKRAR